MVLTPLVDIVFLLLTFFMLSSQLTPFSMLTLEGQASGPASAAPPLATSGEARPDALLSVDAGRVRLNGRVLSPGALLPALREEAASGTTRLTILASADATVQDFVAALEAAKIAAFASIAVADMR
ncbi:MULTISPECIES: ExbD/TolR family protein [unclassified Aureimonas]|uniref:ExbD/TolR family protein n=1 Tax=unclassified Aureimonas TaxID=2615206 RepID=UPI0006FA10C4|nr:MULTISPECIES: biopolymer transporter ExbD [unclassified Aureimonas]KQT57504.1 hypothetical protein ASG62_09330 [Aureimonas sp. Leaf427]KQT77184.1 hypothetical protein ASG54_13200 [Aureimonas sp. Leaf460]